jgi:VanZ family protein
MIYLFIASFVLVIYGTLFPFSFQADAHTGGIVAAFINSASVRPSGGDLISNIVLFLPFGFLGMQALPERIPKLVRYALVFGLGTATSLGIEISQYYTTMRTTSVYDLGLNAISVLIGAVAGGANWQRFVSGGATYGIRPRSIYPLAAVAAWAGYRLFPYVPTIDFQHVKDAIKPLLAITSVPITDVVRHFGMVLGLALLLQAIFSPRSAILALILMALGVIAAKPFIVTTVISPAEVVGTVAALAIWLAVLSQANSRTMIVVVIFAAALAVQGLAPFELSTETENFSFVPFSGFEQGSMAVNLQSFFEKVFLYGTFIWLIVQAGGSTKLSLTLVVIFATTIEIAQRYIVGRSPEITDPMLALIMGGALLTLERHYQVTSGTDEDR